MSTSSITSTVSDPNADSHPPSSSGRTSPESCPPRTTPLVASLAHSLEKTKLLSRQGSGGRTLVLSLDPKDKSATAFSTLNTSEWPNDAVVCSLSQVLETDSVPQRFYLSPKACAGILRRAEKRGKTLPEPLETALRSVGENDGEDQQKFLPRSTLDSRTGQDETRGGVCVTEWPAELAPTLDARFGEKQGGDNQHVNGGCGLFVPDITHTLRAEGFDASEDGTGRGTPLVPVVGPLACNTGPRGHDAGNFACNQAVDSGHVIPVAFSCKDHGGDASEIAPTLRSMGHDGSHANGGGQVAVAFTTEQTPKFNHNQALTLTKQSPSGGGQPQCVATVAVAFIERGREGGRSLEVQEELTYSQMARNGGGATDRFQIMTPAMQVRRLTPTECERLQGFPDGWTKISWRKKPAEDCPDGPRYKVLGNSMAVPCMAWIGRKIAKHLQA